LDSRLHGNGTLNETTEDPFQGAEEVTKSKSQSLRSKLLDIWALDLI
jgi:hypothetical protein